MNTRDLAIAGLVVVIGIIGTAGIGSAYSRANPIEEPADCAQLLHLATSEHEVILVLTAKPSCGAFVTDSLLAPMAPATP